MSFEHIPLTLSDTPRSPLQLRSGHPSHTSKEARIIDASPQSECESVDPSKAKLFKQ
jgi:hypothetical protein